MSENARVWHRRVGETPLAVIDFETTGLTPGADRAVEMCVVRIDPGQPPRIAFDSLINPQRRMAATEIHGITDEDVADAPRFEDVAGDVIRAIDGCVVAAYNVYFDIKFLNYELKRAGVGQQTPHLCLMYLRPMLGLGSRCRLDQACRDHGIAIEQHHAAACDTRAAAQLALLCLAEMQRRGIQTYSDLADLNSYKFTESWAWMPPDASQASACPRCQRIKSRSGFAPAKPNAPVAVTTRAAAPLEKGGDRLRVYWEDLKQALSDLDTTDLEAECLIRTRNELGLEAASVRSLHARAFASVIISSPKIAH